MPPISDGLIGCCSSTWRSESTVGGTTVCAALALSLHNRPARSSYFFVSTCVSLWLKTSHAPLEFCQPRKTRSDPKNHRASLHVVHTWPGITKGRITNGTLDLLIKVEQLFQHFHQHRRCVQHRATTDSTGLRKRFVSSSLRATVEPIKRILMFRYPCSIIH